MEESICPKRKPLWISSMPEMNFALQSSVKQLKGSVSDKIRKLREDILYEIAYIESALDDPEHISLDGYHDRLSEKNRICQQ